MRSNFTVVNGTWQESVKVAFVAANCLVLLVTLHVGILANLFVAWAVYHQKSLQTSNNALLVNLAVIDILRCAIDCPFLLSVVLSARDARDLGLLFCGAQIASFSLICCVQLLTLASISAERYQAIARPFQSAERRKRVALWIALTWLLPVSISAVCVVFAKDSPVYVRCRGLRMETLRSYDTFGFYVLTPIWCVCLSVIVGFYGRIFLLVRAHGRKIFDKGSFPVPGKKENNVKQNDVETKTDVESPRINHLNMNEKQPPGDLNSSPKPEEFLKTTVTEKPKEAQVTFEHDLPNATQLLEVFVVPTDHQETFTESFSSSANEAVAESSTNHDGKASGESSDKDGMTPNAQINVATESFQSFINEKGEEEETKNHGDASLSNEDDGNELAVESHHTAEETSTTLGRGSEEHSALKEPAAETSPASAAPQEEEVVGAVCMMPSLAQRERGRAKKESKLAKRSAYIVFTFLVFWIPLIATVVFNHFYYQDGNLTVEVFQELEILTVSLVCVTSFTNPIIYAAVNPQFRTEFHYLKMKWKAFFTRS